MSCLMKSELGVQIALNFWGGDSIFKSAVYYGLIKGNGYNVLHVWFVENKDKLEALISNISLRT